MKYTKKSSSLELRGSGALNMECSIALWAFSKFDQMKVRGSKMALLQGVKGSNWRNALKIFKNLLIQKHFAQMLEIYYIALPGSPSPISSKHRTQEPRWVYARGPCFEPWKCIKIFKKKLLLQNHLTQMLEIWYVAFPSGPLPSLIK